MARVKIDLPDVFVFATEIDVRVTDMNYGAHLGNDAMVSLIHEARVRFLRSHNLTERDIAGTSVLQADLAIVYRAEAFAGDQLRFEIAMGELGRASCELLYRATRVADGKIIAEAKTGLVFVDKATRKIAALPEPIRRLAPETSSAHKADNAPP